MPEWEKDDNARRKGRKGFREGAPLDANPMRCSCSRHLWEEAWLEEKRICDARATALAKPRENRLPVNYYTDVEI